MKFKIREGFVVLLRQKQYDDPEKPDRVTGVTEVRFQGGKAIELDDAAAAAHLHKLEPVDADAAKFLEDRVTAVAAPPTLDVSALTSALHATLVRASRS